MCNIWQWLVPQALKGGLSAGEVLPYLDSVIGAWNQIPILEQIVVAYQNEGTRDMEVEEEIERIMDELTSVFMPQQYIGQLHSIQELMRGV